MVFCKCKKAPLFKELFLYLKATDCISQFVNLFLVITLIRYDFDIMQSVVYADFFFFNNLLLLNF